MLSRLFAVLNAVVMLRTSAYDYSEALMQLNHNCQVAKILSFHNGMPVLASLPRGEAVRSLSHVLPMKDPRRTLAKYTWTSRNLMTPIMAYAGGIAKLRVMEF